MTVISEPIEDIAGAGFGQPITFVVPMIRQSADGTSTVVEVRHSYTPVAGVLTTGDLDPGPAVVRIRHATYNIVIPASATPVRLWPLIDAGMPTPPPTAEGFVRNGGGIARAVALTQIEYDAIPTPDPETFYVIVDS